VEEGEEKGHFLLRITAESKVSCSKNSRFACSQEFEVTSAVFSSTFVGRRRAAAPMNFVC